MVEMEVGEDLHVAEEYDPMAFFAGPADLNQAQEPDPNVGQAVDSSIIGKFNNIKRFNNGSTWGSTWGSIWESTGGGGWLGNNADLNQQQEPDPNVGPTVDFRVTIHNIF